jgi:catechol 2,3-dioxygenase-like lactoylglutathione lyase family enzyme
MRLGNWLKPLFWATNVANLVVSDLDSAAAWYREKLDCKTRAKTDEDEGDWDDIDAVVFCSIGGLEAICLMKPSAGKDDGHRSDGSDAIIYCKDLNKGAEFLSSRSVSVGGIQEDGDGSRFFNIQDLDGNKLQILEA